MKKYIEKTANFLILSGFLIFSCGLVFTLIILSSQHRVPLEIEISLLGLSLILLGVLAAKIFSEVE